MASASLSVVGIWGARRDKQTLSANDCVLFVGLRLDSLEVAAERRLRSKLNLKQHLVSLCCYRVPSASG